MIKSVDIALSEFRHAVNILRKLLPNYDEAAVRLHFETRRRYGRRRLQCTIWQTHGCTSIIYTKLKTEYNYVSMSEPGVTDWLTLTSTTPINERWTNESMQSPRYHHEHRCRRTSAYIRPSDRSRRSRAGGTKQRGATRYRMALGVVQRI